MMNFWPPTWSPWGDGFSSAGMPFYVHYDYVKTWTYNSQTDGFDEHWTDDFNGGIDYSRWKVSDGWSFDGNNAIFSYDGCWTENGNLVFRMDNWGNEVG